MQTRFKLQYLLLLESRMLGQTLLPYLPYLMRHKSVVRCSINRFLQTCRQVEIRIALLHAFSLLLLFLDVLA